MVLILNNRLVQLNKYNRKIFDISEKQQLANTK